MYDTRYDEDFQCSWTLVAAENNVVVIRFTSFELEDDEMCTYDHVEVKHSYYYLPHNFQMVPTAKEARWAGG